MGYYLAFPILIIAVVLQSSIISLFFGGIAQPELMFLIVLSWAVHAEWEEAIFWAFLGGIMQDLLSSTPTGTSVVAPILIIFAIKWLESGLYRFNFLFLVGFVILGTLLHHLIVIITMGMVGYSVDLAGMISTFSIPTLLYNLLGIVPVYVFLRRIQKRLPKSQSAWSVNTYQ